MPRSPSSASGPAPGRTSRWASARDCSSACTPPTAANAEEWADTAALSKGLEPGHPLRGEEWLGGPVRDARRARRVPRESGGSREGRQPAEGREDGCRPRRPPAGAHLPARRDRRSAAVGVHRRGLVRTRDLRPAGTRVCGPRPAEPDAQLAASASSSAPATSPRSPCSTCCTNCSRYNRVVILKVNPTQDALVPVYERALAPLIEPGFLRIVRGGGDVGAYLTSHAGIDHVHITGAAPTFDAIVWGTGAAATRRRREGRPQLKKPITAELGGVSPIIIVPGRVERRRPAVPGRARRDDAAAEQRAQLHRRPGRDPQLGLAAARRVPRRAAHGVRGCPRASGLVPAQRRETRGCGIQLSERDPPRRRHARARRDRAGRRGDRARDHGVLRARARGRRSSGQRPGVPRRGRRARERAARGHARRQRPDRSRPPRQRWATGSSARSPTCATARSRSTRGRPSHSSLPRSPGAATPARLSRTS